MNIAKKLQRCKSKRIRTIMGVGEGQGRRASRSAQAKILGSFGSSLK